jgi:hypothetical protein
MRAKKVLFQNGKRRKRHNFTGGVICDRDDDNGPDWELPDVENYDSGCGSEPAIEGS